MMAADVTLYMNAEDYQQNKNLRDLICIYNQAYIGYQMGQHSYYHRVRICVIINKVIQNHKTKELSSFGQALIAYSEDITYYSSLQTQQTLKRTISQKPR